MGGAPSNCVRECWLLVGGYSRAVIIYDLSSRRHKPHPAGFLALLDHLVDLCVGEPHFCGRTNVTRGDALEL